MLRAYDTPLTLSTAPITLLFLLMPARFSRDYFRATATEGQPARLFGSPLDAFFLSEKRKVKVEIKLSASARSYENLECIHVAERCYA